jgi:hypothetical protein
MEPILNAWLFMGWLGFQFWFWLRLWKFSCWLASKSENEPVEIWVDRLRSEMITKKVQPAFVKTGLAQK